MRKGTLCRIFLHFPTNFAFSHTLNLLDTTRENLEHAWRLLPLKWNEYEVSFQYKLWISCLFYCSKPWQVYEETRTFFLDKHKLCQWPLSITPESNGSTTRARNSGRASLTCSVKFHFGWKFTSSLAARFHNFPDCFAVLSRLSQTFWSSKWKENMLNNTRFKKQWACSSFKRQKLTLELTIIHSQKWCELWLEKKNKKKKRVFWLQLRLCEVGDSSLDQ